MERLQTSYIDILFTHVWDDGTPIEETLETLNWLVEQGNVRTESRSHHEDNNIVSAGEVCRLQQHDRLATAVGGN